MELLSVAVPDRRHLVYPYQDDGDGRKVGDGWSDAGNPPGPLTDQGYGLGRRRVNHWSGPCQLCQWVISVRVESSLEEWVGPFTLMLLSLSSANL